MRKINDKKVRWVVGEEGRGMLSTARIAGIRRLVGDKIGNDNF